MGESKRNKIYFNTSKSIQDCVQKIYKMPVALEDVLSIRKSIDKIVKTGEGDQEMELLKRLAKMEMNLQILTQTKIGYSVHALKKSSKNDETVSKAKSLIKSWRKFVPDENPKKEKEFRPNMTPKEVLQAGSFGGTFFRPIKSSV